MRAILSALLVMVLTSNGGATPPRTLGYQGVLTDNAGSVVPDGTYAMTFAIYLAPSGGTALWTETQNVAVTNGNFDVILGSVNPITGPSFNDPYWLGLQVDSDPEMTPRTELTGVAYSQISRTVENGAINSSKIADDTVVRSLNGLEDSVGIVGGNNVTVMTAGNNIEISASSGSENVPGVASAKGVTSGTLSGTLNNLAFRSIDCPADGFVLAIASTDVYLNHVSGNPTWVEVGTSDEANAIPSNQDVVAQIPHSAPSGIYTIPLSSHGLYSVSAGINSFYLLGRIGSVSGTASVDNRQLTLIYFETSYGTVSPTVAGEVSQSREAKFER